MTPYRYTQLALVITVVPLLAGWIIWYWPFWLVAIPLAIYVAAVAMGSYFISSSFHLKAICKGDKSKNHIALTFDDGPHPETTLAILAVLKQHQVKATFFCIGQQVEQYKPIAQQIVAEGHLVGNHSWAHGFWFDLQSGHNMQVELNKTNHLLQQVTGRMPRYFRPPYGATTPWLAKAIKDTQMIPIGWSLRSMDTAIKNPNRLLKRITQRVNAGDIVLFHDTQTGTVSVLGSFIKHCKQNGIEIVPLNELINIPAYD